MKKEIYILMTAGRGPVECGLAVHGVQQKFKSYLNANNVEFEIVSQKKGQVNKAIETIVFKVLNTEMETLEPWLGTIQWICKSPIRKFHKRKNWYIKCHEISLPKQVKTINKDVTIQTYRASGPGGQHRNKVETAIRIIHNPTGIIVTASDGKSQAQNKKKAWQKLEIRLKARNDDFLKEFSLEQWTSKVQIERGNSIKTFNGLKFT